MPDLRVATFLAPNVLPVYEAITRAVEDRLGLSAELIVETDYENCKLDLYEICFVCSLPYVSFESEGIAPAVPVAAPVLRGDRYGGLPIYYSDVIVHRDSSLETFADLRGASWAYNEPLSHSGYGITRYHLVRIGETNGFFGAVVESGFHERSMEMVSTGEIDASAIDSQVLGVAMRDDPALASTLRIIDSLGPSTIQPVAVSRRLDAEMRADIAQVLLDMHRDGRWQGALAHGDVDRFVAVGPPDYDDIRQMLTACEEADFMELR
jgi:phosphonate transport system substrate-binding protein